MRRLWMAAALSVTLAACGQDKLDSEQTGRVAEANSALAMECFDGSHYAEALDGVDALIAIYRQDPDAVYQPGDTGPELTMRQVVADAAGLIDCRPQLSDELDRALEAGA